MCQTLGFVTVESRVGTNLGWDEGKGEVEGEEMGLGVEGEKEGGGDFPTDMKTNRPT